MRRQMIATLMSVSLLFAIAGIGPLSVSAASTCVSRNVNFQYFQMLDASYETVTIHAAGCYNGTKSSGTHIHVTATGPWPLEGSSVPAPDPSYFSSTTTGNTWWVARPVYGAPMGIDLLLTPSVMLSGIGVWYAYDYSTKACSNGMELIYLMGEAWGPGNFWTLGLKDLKGGGSGTGSCTALTAMNPIFIKLWFATYTA